MNLFLCLLTFIFMKRFEIHDVLEKQSLFQRKRINDHKINFYNDTDYTTMFINSMTTASLMNF